MQFLATLLIGALAAIGLWGVSVHNNENTLLKTRQEQTRIEINTLSNKVASLVEENFKLGATLTEVTGSTLLSDLDTVLTTNFHAINAQKLENGTSTGWIDFGYLTASSTSASTTLQSVNNIGTLSIGGLGTTTLHGNGATSTFSGVLSSVKNLIAGGSATTTIRGSSATSTFSGGINLSGGCFAGVSGSCLTAFNAAQTYNLTGNNVFNPSGASTTIVGNATTTGTFNVGTTLRINGVSYAFPTTQIASSSLITDGSGGLSFGAPLISVGASTTDSSFGSGGADNTYTHGLNRLPRLIRIDAICRTASTGSNGGLSISYGIATSTASQYVVSGGVTDETPNDSISANTRTVGRIMECTDAEGNIDYFGVLNAITTTTFTINWTTQDALVGAKHHFTWEIE